MEIEKTPLNNCLVITPRVFKDERGSFSETFNTQTFLNATGIDTTFVQDNQSISSYGVIRGLHFQKGARAQAKLVRVIQGKVLDVVVDLRKQSATYGNVFSIELSAQNGKQLFVPRGFAHGFSVLENNTIFAYKCDNFYDKASEGGIIYNDPMLQIDWKIAPAQQLVSVKDQELPTFNEINA